MMVLVMGVAITLKQYLGLDGGSHGEDYDRVSQVKINVQETAKEAHVPADKIAKCVMLEDEGGYVMVICPVTNRVKLERLYREINRQLHFASEQDLVDIQGETILDAMSSVSDIYDIEVVVDDALIDKSDIYFEASNGRKLVHLKADDLQHLFQNAEHAAFSQPI